MLIVETRGGLVCANAGIDASNVPGIDRVTLLPEDPDASARRVRHEIRAVAGVAPAIVIADSVGRPWRLGQADVAIGCAGLVVIDDWRGRDDREGRPLTATAVAIADEVAAAGDLARAKDEGVPACVVVPPDGRDGCRRTSTEAATTVAAVPWARPISTPSDMPAATDVIPASSIAQA